MQLCAIDYVAVVAESSLRDLDRLNALRILEPPSTLTSRPIAFTQRTQNPLTHAALVCVLHEQLVAWPANIGFVAEAIVAFLQQTHHSQ